MKAYSTILSLLVRYAFRRGEGKSSRYRFIAYAFIAIVYLVLAAGIWVTVSELAGVFVELEILPELITLVLGISCAATLFFGLIPTATQLYFSSDSEFMTTLPVKPSVVFLAKLTYVYLTETVVGALIAVPALLSLGFAVPSLGAGYYVVILLAVILCPALPMTLAAILSAPLMKIVSFFKNKGAAASIALVLLFAVVFGGYYALLGNIASSDGSGEIIDPEAVILSLKAGLTTVTNVLFPLSAAARLAVGSTATLFGEFALPAAIAINLATLLLSFVLFAAIAAFISSIAYESAVQKIAEGNGSVAVKKAGKEETSTPLVALMKKEWREMLRTPAFAFQCLGCAVLCPILIAFFASGFESGAIAAEGLGDVKLLVSFVCLLMICVMGVSTNVGACTSYTREGKNFHVLKTVPLEAKTIVKSKLLVYLIVSTVSIVASLAVTAVVAFHPINLACGAVFLLAYNYGFNCFCQWFDLRKPKLNWVTQNEAVKNNRNVVVPTLLNMAVSVVLTFVPVIYFVLVPSAALALALGWATLFAVAVAVAVVFHNLLYANCERLLAAAFV